MKDVASEKGSRKMTEEEMTYQYEILDKHRESGVIPSIQQIARSTATAINTAHNFIQGNSRNEKIRAYLKARIIKNLKPLPPEMKKLFSIWEDTARE